MQYYSGSNHGSGIAEYEVGEDHIRVRFLDGSVYLYTYGSTGRHHIEVMKSLAEEGDGLNTFINQHVRKAYEEREH